MERDYKNMSLEKLNILDLDYFVKYRDTGGKHECDHSINEISTSRIMAFKKKKGKAFLVKHHVKNGQPFDSNKIFIPYTGQDTQAFEYHYVVSEKDMVLESMLKQIQQDIINVRFVEPPEVLQRVLDIGGIFLTWV